MTAKRTTHTFITTNKRQAETYLQAHCNDGRAWLVWVTFGEATAVAYRQASEFPVDAPGMAWQFDGRYWKNGAWHTMPRGVGLRYHNSSLGCE